MLLKLSKFFLYTSLFSVVVVLSTTFFPFIGGKYYFFRIVVELALICFILHWGFEAKKGEVLRAFRFVSEKPLFIAVSFFVLMFLLASLFAYDSHAAFWSNYERGDGGFQMLHYYVFFVLATLLFTTERDWNIALRASLVAGFLMILYGILAAQQSSILGINFVGPYFMGGSAGPTFLSRIFSNARFQGSLGNPAYVAPYLLFSFFYLIWLWLHGNRSWKKNCAYSALGIFFLIFFWLSGTRGSFLGLIAAIAVVLCYLFIFQERKKRKIALFALLGFALVSGLLWYSRNSNLVKQIPGSRLLDISFSEQTAQTRLWTWGSAWKGFKERPFLGWGPENFSVVFDRHFDPRHFIPSQSTETWFDRAHSVVFDYLAETGALGFLGFIGIFVVLYLEFWRIVHSRKEKEVFLNVRLKERKPFARALFIALPVGYFIQALILFDVLPIYINLFLFFAFAFSHFYHIRSAHE